MVFKKLLFCYNYDIKSQSQPPFPNRLRLIQERAETKMLDLYAPVPASELRNRLEGIRSRLSAADPTWQLALISQKINLYYLTGTLQEGVVLLTPDSAVFWVRRSYEAARRESLFDDIRPMRSFRTIAESLSAVPDTVWLETGTVSLDWLSRARKYLPFSDWRSLDPILSAQRAIKSDYELDCMRRAGVMHADVIENIAPSLARTGMSEAELCGEIYLALLRKGYMGVGRFAQPYGEGTAGICSFGENAIAPGAFDSPSGSAGTCLAVKSVGSPNRLLAPGDLILLDISGGLFGYHTDKTVVYHFGPLAENPHAELIARAYAVCLNIERQIAAHLTPGAIPETLYQTALDMVPDEFESGFMNGSKFIGHSVGLVMDEPPVLARSFTNPLCEGMTIAVEPKIALPGIGLVGTENTYLVTTSGGVSLTGTPQPLREISL